MAVLLGVLTVGSSGAVAQSEQTVLGPGMYVFQTRTRSARCVIPGSPARTLASRADGRARLVFGMSSRTSSVWPSIVVYSTTTAGLDVAKPVMLMSAVAADPSDFGRMIGRMRPGKVRPCPRELRPSTSMNSIVPK